MRGGITALSPSSILTSIKISKCLIKNRLGLGPINSGLFTETGEIIPAGLEFYSQYFTNNVGLAFVGGVAVSPEGKSSQRSYLLDDPRKGLGLACLVKLAHQHRCKIAVQLMHAGRQTNPDEIGVPIVACSALPCPIVDKLPIELNHDGIKRVIEDFVRSAQIAEQSGVDLIEIHAAHGYLISGFLSPYSNHRNDEYGGTLENRFRFLTELISEVRRRVNIPVGIRINCVENVSGGLGIDDVEAAMHIVAEVGIDYISVSGGVYAQDDIIMPPRDLKALWRDYARRLKQTFSLPILLSGNIDSIDLANELIEKGETDIVLMVRSLLADPAILTKWMYNRNDEVQECIDCRLCKYHTLGLNHVYCPFNPVLDKYQGDKIEELQRSEGKPLKKMPRRL
jgi:2,4-dienoyl-CoA reductase-like NADH-dependent reductase (Old Yellow Enzyme family)